MEWVTAFKNAVFIHIPGDSDMAGSQFTFKTLRQIDTEQGFFTNRQPQICFLPYLVIFTFSVSGTNQIILSWHFACVRKCVYIETRGWCQAPSFRQGLCSSWSSVAVINYSSQKQLGEGNGLFHLTSQDRSSRQDLEAEAEAETTGGKLLTILDHSPGLLSYLS